MAAAFRLRRRLTGFLPGAKGGLYSWEQVQSYPEVILVEGLFDYAVLWQAGFHNVTCSLGTHLNARQFRQLCDGPRTVYLAFDADGNGSGQQAAQCLSRRLRERGITARLVSLPDGHDPNSFFVQGRRCAPVPVSAGGRSAMKFRVVHQPLQQRTKSGSRCRADHRPRGRLDQSFSGPRVRAPPGGQDPAHLCARAAALSPLVGECSSHRRDRRRCAHRIDPAGLCAIPVRPTTELSGSTINQRVAVADRALRNEFPDAPCQIARGFHQAFLRRRPMGLGRPRLAMSRLRVKTPKRNIVPLSVDEVARFWSSFRTSRDLAIVGLMLLQGLRSAEVLALNRDDLLLSGSADPRARQRQQDPLPAAGSGSHSTARSLSAAGTARSLQRRAVRLAERTRTRNAHDTCGITLLVPLPSPDHRRQARQPASVSTHLCLRYGARRRQPARAHAVDGARRHPDHAALCAGHSTRGLPAVCARRGPAHPPPSGDPS